MNENRNGFLEQQPLGKLMRKYSVPCIISLLVGALYNIVDQIFIANASYLGSYGNAANTVVYPLTVIALALAVMIGDGACTFVSISLGAKQPEKARDIVGSAVVNVIGISVILMAVYLLLRNPILVFFGGAVNETTYQFAQEYFLWITLGIPAYMFGQAMNPIIRSDGDPRFAMIASTAGAITNIILDPIMIYGFRWGMMGAAVATVLGQVLTAVLSIWYLRHMKTMKLSMGSIPSSYVTDEDLYSHGRDIVPVTGKPGRIHGCRQQHGSKVQRIGSDLLPGGIQPDSHGGNRYRYEVFPDCDFDLYWGCCRLCTDCRI